MQPEMILKSDVLDILFENRNKAYGAYLLRREYDDRVRKALLITFSLIAVCLLIFSKMNTGNTIDKAPVVFTNTTVVLKEAPHFKEEPSGGQKKKAAMPVATTGPALKPKIVDDKKIAKTPDVIKPVQPNTVTIAANTTGTVKQGTATDGDGSDGNGKTPGVTTGDNNGAGSGLVLAPDVEAKFPGGIEVLHEFLKMTVIIPDIENDETILVKVGFVVNADGSISGLHIIQSGGNECDESALAAIKKMPAWIPAVSQGHKVASYFVLPFRFIPNEE